MVEVPDAQEHDLVAHLFVTSLQLMQETGNVFLPLEVVAERLAWDDETMGAVVDHCVATDPIAAGRLRAEWMDDGDRRAFGADHQRFIGIRPSGG